jgi:hypothetical protein
MLLTVRSELEALNPDSLFFWHYRAILFAELAKGGRDNAFSI